ncbi:MAG: 5'/3'-nucleotidase SurE [Sorangium cellulosum]|nr:MAG: 5'/3'-nucleotidase SurE [Sorangium cellulosum]
MKLSMAEQALILLTNDDGYGAPGLEAMAQALEGWARVVVIAPQDEQSACSHKFSLGRSLRLHRKGQSRFSLDGTPADCVYVGIYGGTKVLERTPDLVVSGLNAGLNLGYDTYYSGTVAGAREAALRGVSGIAVSADTHADCEKAALFCSTIVFAYLKVALELSEPAVLNVNVPAFGSWKLTKTRLGRRTYGDGVVFRKDPRGKEYLWLGGSGTAKDDSTPGTDTLADQCGEIGITHLPLTPHDVGCDGVVDAVLREANNLKSKD